MENKSLLLTIGLAIVISSTGIISYTIKLVDQQKQEQQEQLHSIVTKIEQLKTSKEHLTYKDQPDTNEEDNSLLQTQLSQQLNDIHEKLNAMDVEQQQLTHKIKKQADELANLALSQQENGNAMNVAAAEKSAEEILAEEQARTEAISQNLENYWQQQDIASGWAENKETAVRDVFTQANGFEVSDISCKTNLCRLEVTPTQEANMSPSDLLMQHPDSSTMDISEMYTQTNINTDGSESVVIYFTEEGSSLPKELMN